MRERPILFTGPMVRALLDGRKTQTRRVIKPQPPTERDFRGATFSLDRAIADGVKMYSLNDYDRLPKHPTDWTLMGSVGVARDGGFPRRYRCPYGAPGDRLWVRETWGLNDYQFERGPIPKALPAQLEDNGLCYAATEDDSEIRNELRWRSSIHMPRWASRLTLEITEVRVERLQNISEADAIAEGATPRAVEGAVGGQRWCMDWSRVGSVAFGTTRIRPQDIGLDDPQMAFANYINQLHGGPRWNFYYNGDARYPKPIWDVNPWVWAITFRVLP